MLKKSMILVGTIVLAAATVSPAAAQRYGQGGYGGGEYAQRIHQAGARIIRANANGRLDRGEFFSLRRDQRALEYLLQRFRRGGLSGWERQQLDHRIDALMQRMRYAMRDGGRNGGRYGGGYDDGRSYDRDDDGRWGYDD